MKNLIDNSFLELVEIESVTDGVMENMVDISVAHHASFTLSNGMISHNSAVSGVNEARDAKIHGALPLRGKILNVHGMAPKTAYESEALRAIMDSLGLVPTQKAVRENLRYGQLHITCDADADGLNIAALLVNFFYTFWPELFDPANPFIYVFDTPLIIAKKGKEAKYWYSDDAHEFHPDEYKGWDITRAKGLAALKKDDWAHVLKNPKLTPITDDDGKMKETLSLLFDPKKTNERKDWIGI